MEKIAHKYVSYGSCAHTLFTANVLRFYAYSARDVAYGVFGRFIRFITNLVAYDWLREQTLEQNTEPKTPTEKEKNSKNKCEEIRS